METKLSQGSEILSENQERIVVIDVLGHDAITGRCPVAASGLETLLQTMNLALPTEPPAKKSRGDSSSHHAALERIENLLNEDENGITTVVFGSASDPLDPFEGKFDLTLKVLETISAYRPKQLIFKTRSPLVVIALPALKALGDSVRVVIALEALRDGVNSHFTPGLPRPSERIKAARTLYRFGINTELQIAPLLPTHNYRKELLLFSKVLSEIAHSVRLLSFAELIHLSLKPSGGKRWELLRNAHALLAEQITALAPAKVVTAACGNCVGSCSSLAA